MAGYGAACLAFYNSVKLGTKGNGIPHSIQTLVGNGSVGDKQQIVNNILTLEQTVLDIVFQALGIVAPVLLDYAHLTTLDLNAGLQIQQVCAQSRGRGAAATLDHIFQSVQQKTGFHPLCIGLDIGLKLLQALAVMRLLAGIDNHVSLAGGEILRIHDHNIIKFRSSQAEPRLMCRMPSYS